MDRYLYIKSNASEQYFSNNQVYQFKVHLHVPLSLQGMWKVGLVEFHAEINTKVRTTKKVNQTLYVYSDLCKSSILEGSEQPLLRRLESNTRTGWSYSLDNVFYLPIKKKELIEFEIIIKTEDGELASLLKSPVCLTLHLKPYPFYSDYESV